MHKCCLFILLFFCAVSCKDSSNKIVVTGSSTVAPLARELASEFEKLNPGIRIDVQMGGSSRGLADARKGLADIGMVSRALKENETDVIAHKVAVDGISIIAHRDNALSNVTTQQLVDIYRGNISNWKEIGGADLPISVVNKADGRSTLELFCKHFKLKPEEIKASVVIGDNEQGIQTVAGNPGAIGYVSIGTAEYDVSKGIAIKLMDLDGKRPSRAAVKEGSFPISRPLNFVTKEAPTGVVKAFIDFATSRQADPFVEGQFFVPLGS